MSYELCTRFICLGPFAESPVLKMPVYLSHRRLLISFCTFFQVPKPSKEEFDKALQAVDNAIEDLKKKRQSIQTQIDKTMEGNSKTEASRERDLLHELRMKRGILINEKKKIRDKLSAMKGAADKIETERRSAKQTMKFTKVEDIQAEIRRLEKKQETTSMSLQEEKRIIKEIDALNASKKTVAALKGKEQELEDSKEQRAIITAELKAKDADIDAVQKAIDEKQELVKTLSEKDTDHRDKLTKFFSERDAVKEEINQNFKEKNALQNEFRAKNDEYFTYTRAVKAQQKLQYEEEKKRREEEKQAYVAKLEEEEMKKIPYEEEQALCDYLAKYLTTAYLEPLEKGGEEGDEDTKEDVVPVADNPFANLKPVNKKTDDVFLQMGSAKKIRQKKSKQVKKQDKQAPFKLNMDTFEQFALIDLIPPTSLEEVSKSVEELKAKKEWYSKQPRGSVPTAKEIRKANEIAANKIKSTGHEGTLGKATNSNNKKSPEFSLSSDDFAPLGAGASSSAVPLNSSWRQNAPVE